MVQVNQMHNTQVLRRKQLKYHNISTNNRVQGVIEKRMGEVKCVKLQYERCSHHHNLFLLLKKYRMQVVNSSYCSSSSIDEEDSDLEHNEIQGMEPYQFEPELTNDEPKGPEDVTDAKDLEHRRDNTDW